MQESFMATITLDVPDSLVPALDSLGDQLPLVLEMGMSRLAPVSTQAYMEALELLSQNPAPELVADFRYSDEVEARTAELLEKQSTGTITQADEVELERLSHLELLLQRVKMRAVIQLKAS